MCFEKEESTEAKETKINSVDLCKQRGGPASWTLGVLLRSWKTRPGQELRDGGLWAVRATEGPGARGVSEGCSRSQVPSHVL